MKVTRPILRYHGGKWRLAPWIIAHMPRHKVYVEAFGGGGSVLLRKAKIAAEVYNDLDGRVVQVFRVLQDQDAAERLRRRLELTPFARAEFERSYEPSDDPVESVARTIMLSQMGYGNDSISRRYRTAFRVQLTDERATPALAWSRWPDVVPAYVDRLRGVAIEQADALSVMQRFDSMVTLHYVDPPYVTSTRSSLSDGRAATHGYKHELTDSDHEALAAGLRSLRGMVLVSGYRSELYDELYSGWERLQCETLADGARPRTECLWLNPACVAGLSRQVSIDFTAEEVFSDD